MLLNGDRGAGVGTGCGTAGREAGRVHLGQIVPAKLTLQRQLDVEVLGDWGVHDPTGEYVGETAVVACAPRTQKESRMALP